VIRAGGRRKNPGELDWAVAVRCAHRCNLDALIAQSSDTSGPFFFDRGSPFEIDVDLAKESDSRFEVIDDDSYVVHPFERHVTNLRGGTCGDNGPRQRRRGRRPRETDHAFGQRQPELHAIREVHSRSAQQRISCPKDILLIEDLFTSFAPRQQPAKITRLAGGTVWGLEKKLPRAIFCN
jgi:hypothetical protein